LGGQNTSFGQQSGINQSLHLQQQLQSMSNSPYGLTSNLKNENIFNPISPLAQRQYIIEATSPTKVTSVSSAINLNNEMSSNKGGLSQTIKLQPKALANISLNKKTTDIFEGLDEEEAPCFYPRKNIKKLLFKPQIHHDQSSAANQQASHHSSTNSSLNGDTKVDVFSMRDKGVTFLVGSHHSHDLANDFTDDNNQDVKVADIVVSSTTTTVVTSPPHPANIILERPGYFTIPSMQDLASMTDMKTGDCYVENFAIGRVDYGCITFPGVTNAANLNLDEIVFIRRKEVHVYPDDSKKPQVSQGLNKQAEITLHRIWPQEKLTKQPITDTQRILKMGYYKRIEKATTEMDAQFVDYDPITGSWTFKVKHFSKYGLNDDDDDDDAENNDSDSQDNYQGAADLQYSQYNSNGVTSSLNRLSRSSADQQQKQLQSDQSILVLNSNDKSSLGRKHLKKEIDANNLNKNGADANKSNNANLIKQEKDMIEKQLHLIERRRLELTQSSKAKAANGIGGAAQVVANNLNTITNQQWDILNEYTGTGTSSSTCSGSSSIIKLNIKSGDSNEIESLEQTLIKKNKKPKKKTNKYNQVNQSNILHLELISSSENSQEENDDEDEDQEQEKRVGIRKALILDDDDDIDDDNETEDDEEAEDKENRLNGRLQKPSKKSTVYKKGNKFGVEKIYPNLGKIKQETYTTNIEQLNVEDDNDNDDNEEDDLKYNINQQMDFKMVTNTNSRQRLVDAFFNTNSQVGGRGADSYNYSLFTHTRQDDDEDEENIEQNNVESNMEENQLDYNNSEQNYNFQQYSSFKPNQTYKGRDLGTNTASIGLLKRGLGGISLQENIMLSKIARKTPLNDQVVSVVDIEQRIGCKMLKPKLWNRFQIQQQQAPQKQQYNQDLTNIDQSSHNENQSLTKNLEWCLADVGLFNSRRFKVNWSMHMTPFTFMQLSRFQSQSKPLSFLNSIQFRQPLSISFLSNNSNDPDILNTNVKFKSLVDNCKFYLQAQLDLTEFIPQSNANHKLPLLKTKRGNELIKQMCECANQIRNTIVGDHPDADNVNHDKMVWGLCQSLWGDIPEGFKSNSNESQITSQYELEQMRKRLLSEWLADVSSHRIDRECKLIKFNNKGNNKDGGSNSNYLNSIFSMLTGNRVMNACLSAVDNQDFRLALLLSQSSSGASHGGGGGGNDIFRSMIKKQLNEWYQSNSDKYINMDMLKFYVLISGDLTYKKSNSISNSHLINVCENLDWKRQFALVLWYNCLPINSINDALISYENSIKNNTCTKPVPPYVEDNIDINMGDIGADTDTLKTNETSLFKLNNNKSKFSGVYDTCFHLLKLYCNSSHPIEDIINPLSHSSNRLDTRLSWHLAQSLQALDYNHASRLCLDTLNDSYAQQLQSIRDPSDQNQIGMWHWSIFVLMHINDNFRRESSIRYYLSRYVSSQSDLNEQELFCIEKLHIPDSWIYEYKALKAKYLHEYLNQFELLLKAHKWNEAHLILIDQIAPDLFLRKKLTKLQEYLNVLSKESQYINKWNLGGQVYIDYMKLEINAQYLFSFDVSSKLAADLQDLTKNPQNQMLPDEDSNQKYLTDENMKELNHQLINLSSRIKEFDSKTPKKLLCVFTMAKMLLKYFYVFNELNNSNSSSSSSVSSHQKTRYPKRTRKQLKRFGNDKTIIGAGSTSNPELFKEETDESNNASNDKDEEEEEEEEESGVETKEKCLTRQIVERASHLTECIPEQDLIGTVLLKKSKYTHDFLKISRQR
jgi:hypothetical protein